MLDEKDLKVCESALEEITHARKVMSDLYAPMHEWPITAIQSGERVLESYVLVNEDLADPKNYPLLHGYMTKLKAQHEAMEGDRIYKESKDYKIQMLNDQIKWQENEIVVEKLHVERIKETIQSSEQRLKELKKNLKTLCDE